MAVVPMRLNHGRLAIVTTPVAGFHSAAPVSCRENAVAGVYKR